MVLKAKSAMEVVTVNIKESQLEKLRAKKAEKKRSVSEIIRHLIDKYLHKV